MLHWRSPEPDPDSATLPPLLHLFVCPYAARTSHLLHSRTAEPLEVACWKELDVTDGSRAPPANSAWCCRRRNFRLARGGSGDDTDAEEERALLLSSSDRGKRVCSREIRAQARALQVTAESPPDLGAQSCSGGDGVVVATAPSLHTWTYGAVLGSLDHRTTRRDLQAVQGQGGGGLALYVASLLGRALLLDQ